MPFVELDDVPFISLYLNCICNELKEILEFIVNILNRRTMNVDRVWKFFSHGQSAN